METISYDLLETAKLLRAELKAKFPGTKFSVRTSRFSGGTAIQVTYTDGPRYVDVDTVARSYAAGTFDGMTDSYELRKHVGPGGKLIRYGARFVSTSREYSRAAMTCARRYVNETNYQYNGFGGETAAQHVLSLMAL